jgi:hypothetical protein
MFTSRQQRAQTGAAMVEFVIVAAMMVSTVAIFALLLYAFKEHGWRILNLVASEYP